MAQNTSHAVMAQRKEAHDSLDFFPTPAWGTRALCEWLKARTMGFHRARVHEPACGEGHMVRPLREYVSQVAASDCRDYGFPDAIVHDFLFGVATDADWIITNPPFRLAEQFATKALEIAEDGVALLVRTAFLESATRYNDLFSQTPPTEILQFVERLPMHKGRVDEHGSTATAYCWLVFRKDFMWKKETQFHWLAPCRKRLERDGDYA
jgi:hypothetical protein